MINFRQKELNQVLVGLETYRIVIITGVRGTGKSTLLESIGTEVRKAGTEALEGPVEEIGVVFIPGDDVTQEAVDGTGGILDLVRHFLYQILNLEVIDVHLKQAQDAGF